MSKPYQTSVRPPGKILSVQYLRACAALMVVCHHAISQFAEFPRPFHTAVGQAGVDIFFVISGFVMVFVTATREHTPGSFLMSRATRIIPIYWFYTVGCFALLLVAPSLFTANEASARHLVLSLLFIPHVIAVAPDQYDPLVKLGWTLNYEVFFYIIFALAMVISVGRRVVLTASVLVCLFAAPMIASVLGTEIGGIGTVYTNQIIVEFAFGMTIAVAYFSHKLDWLRTMPAAILVGISFLAMIAGAPEMGHSRILVFGIPAALIVMAALSIERNGQVGRNWLMLLIGDASYSIYLVHIFPLAILRTLWRRFGLPIHGWFYPTIFVTACLLCAVLIGIASYLAIERPSLRWLRGLLASNKHTKSGASQPC